jgi:hypothetical protein
MDGVTLMVLIHDDNVNKCLFICPWWSFAMVKLDGRHGFENSMKKWETKTIRDAPCSWNKYLGILVVMFGHGLEQSMKKCSNF